MTAALRAQPGTARQTTVYQNGVKVPGLPGSVNAWAFGGDSSWLGYGVIAGHWYDAPGQVDVNTSFLTDSGLAVGDTATVDTGTAQVTVRIAGEVFYPDSTPTVYGSAQTLPGLATPANLSRWDVALRPGTSAANYVQAVNAALGSRSPWGATRRDGGQFYSIASELIGTAGAHGRGGRRARRAQHGADDHPGPGTRPRDLQGARHTPRPGADHGGCWIPAPRWSPRRSRHPPRWR